MYLSKYPYPSQPYEVLRGKRFLICLIGSSESQSSIFESARELLNKSYKYARGVKIRANQNRIVIDLYVIFKYGVSINAVARSLKDTVKYNVEDFTGMIVDSVNVHVVGIHV